MKINKQTMLSDDGKNDADSKNNINLIPTENHNPIPERMLQKAMMAKNRENLKPQAN